jgi:hypothetical protein
MARQRGVTHRGEGSLPREASWHRRKGHSGATCHGRRPRRDRGSIRAFTPTAEALSSIDLDEREVSPNWRKPFMTPLLSHDRYGDDRPDR